MSKKVKKSNPFKAAVENTPDIASGYKVGLRALGGYSKLIVLKDNSQCGGSVDIDACTTRKYPIANRWDYVFSYKGNVYFIEIHSAETGEVSTVLRKLQWLKDWLVQEAPHINRLKSSQIPPFYWIQSGRFNIQKTSPQYRQAVQSGIKPIPQLSLK